MDDESCFVCRKHRGEEAAPPGGYVYEDEHWMVCHAPPNKGPLGTLFIESKRHVLDFGEFNSAEAASFGRLARAVYTSLKTLIGPERIYQVSMMEGVPHFHAWIVPRGQDVAEHGVAFLARDLTCTEAAAVELVVALREASSKW